MAAFDGTGFDGTGKVALITGGANGIGAAVARRLAAGGVRLVLADVDERGGAALAAELDGAFVRCDVREPADSEPPSPPPSTPSG
ncbi:SDR family NAD(P)-dependent oxidoreductase, partial [Actinomadura sp. CNU-125]|uniref:SDR family NAD(P)-dependent oxidoreductase n=1 Tax=Actinomadura sp. CNU-125 TaxID=1904961 RepID=UPI00117787F4